jgi:hypothetical protein
MFAKLRFVGLAIFAIACVCALTTPASAQCPAKTTIADTLYNADGSLASGRVTIAWPTFVIGTCQVIAGQTTVTVANGAFSAQLYPNTTAVPVGTSYRVTFALKSGRVTTEYWVVPASAVPVALATVRAPSVPVPAMMLGEAQVTNLVSDLAKKIELPAPCSAGKVLESNGSSTPPQLNCVDPSSGSGSQHQVNGANLASNSPVNFQNSSTVAFTNPGAGNLQASLADSAVTATKLAVSSPSAAQLAGISDSNISAAAISPDRVAGTAVTQSRAISTTSPITGGGDFSANRTIACSTCVTSVSGTANEVSSSGGATPTLSLPSTVDLSSKTMKGGTPLVLDGATADANKTTVVVTDPTAARNFTLPNADSVAVQPLTCGGTDKVSAISSAGVVTCTADQSGGGSSHNLLSATHPDTVAASPVLGGIPYANATPAWEQLAGNTTSTKKFLRQTGNGSISAAPAWDTLVAADVPSLDVAKITTGAFAGARGGTNNGFMDFTGPATSLKTFTLPNASATILTSNAAVSVAQGGTGTGSTLTGLVRGSASAMTAAELSGDVTTSGSNVATLANIPSGTPMAGSLLATNIAAPASPAAGKVSIFTDSTDLRLHDKNASGVIGTTVVADAGASNNFLTGVSIAGVISKAQPTILNLAAFSSANLITQLSDETGSGKAVFSTNPLFDNYTDFTAITAPATPGAGIGRLYFKSSTKMFCGKDDAAVETCMDAGTGGSASWSGLTAPSGAVSMVSDATAEVVTFDFQSAFTTGAQFLIKSSTGNPSGGTLFEVRCHDADPLCAVFGDGTGYTRVNKDGSLEVDTGTAAGAIAIFEAEASGTNKATVTVAAMAADRTVTIAPSADSVTVVPTTCSGTDKVSAVGTDGVPVCTSDQTAAGIVYARTTGNVTSTDATNWADITGLTKSIAASATISFNCSGNYTTAATTTAIHLSVNGPASATNLSYGVWVSIAATGNATDVIAGQSAYDTVTNPASATAVTQAWKIFGTLENGSNAGTLAMRVRSEVASSTVTVLRGAFCSFNTY